METSCKIGAGCVHRIMSLSLAHTCNYLGCSISQRPTYRLQVVITAVWAVSTVVISTFGYSTLRTGAHMADTGTEHNIELIAQVSALHAVILHCAVDTLLLHVQLSKSLCRAEQRCRSCQGCISVLYCLSQSCPDVCPRYSGPRLTKQLACTTG